MVQHQQISNGLKMAPYISHISLVVLYLAPSPLNVNIHL